MASNPSYGRYVSEKTIYETLVGGQSHVVPRFEEAMKQPKPAMFCSYAMPVEKNPFVNIDMLVKPPVDATQESLNQYAREGYIRQALAVDKRVQEQQILQQSTEAKINAIVNDEYERRRAVKRGVYESVGMTPAEIDEKFAGEVLAGQQAAITRATTDGQVRDALTRYFTLRGGVVPAFLQPPTTTADGTNNATGMADGAGYDATLPGEAEYAPEVDYNAEAEDQAELGGAGAPAYEPPSGSANELTPAEEANIEALRADSGRTRAPPTIKTMVKYLISIGVGVRLPSGGMTMSPSYASQKVTWADLKDQVLETFERGERREPPRAVAPALPPTADAPVERGGAAGESEMDRMIRELDGVGDGGGFGAEGGGVPRPDPSLKS